jgi:hypothetical protein
MRAVSPAVEWYRTCIHESQRRANTLSIEIELNARDKDDPGALADAMGCLSSAVAILEQAKAGLTDPDADERVERSRRREIPYRQVGQQVEESGQAMEDLGHSMAPLDVGPLKDGADARSYRNTPGPLDVSRIPPESSLSFFQ